MCWYNVAPPGMRAVFAKEKPADWATSSTIEGSEFAPV